MPRSKKSLHKKRQFSGKRSRRARQLYRATQNKYFEEWEPSIKDDENTYYIILQQHKVPNGIPNSCGDGWMHPTTRDVGKMVWSQCKSDKFRKNKQNNCVQRACTYCDSFKHETSRCPDFKGPPLKISSQPKVSHGGRVIKQLREEVVDFMENYSDLDLTDGITIRNVIEWDQNIFQIYLKHMRLPKTWGGALEIQVMTQLYPNFAFCIFVPTSTTDRYQQWDVYKNKIVENPTELWLLYNRRTHYDALIKKSID